jgi:hypothetical protein
VPPSTGYGGTLGTSTSRQVCRTRGVTVNHRSARKASGLGGMTASSWMTCVSRWAGGWRWSSAPTRNRAAPCCLAAPLDRRADRQLVGRAAPVEPRLRIPSRVERGAHLRRHEPPVAATPDPLTGNRRTIQSGWMTFQTVSEGRILVHNSVRPAVRQGGRGARYWLADPDPTRYEVCDCAWAPGLGQHYRVASE